MSSGRAGYLGWYLRETGDNPEHKKTANRALFVCKEIEARDLAMQQAADAAPDDPAWDAAQS